MGEDNVDVAHGEYDESKREIWKVGVGIEKWTCESNHEQDLLNMFVD